jgi:hypothetical protein
MVERPSLFRARQQIGERCDNDPQTPTAVFDGKRPFVAESQRAIPIGARTVRASTKRR